LREPTNLLNKPVLGLSSTIGLDFVAGKIRRAHDTFFSLPPVLFSRAILADPGAVGAVCPSSSRLARALASQVPLQDDDGLVLELGAGTGRVTEALLERGVNPEKLVAVEQDRLLARHLKDRFTNVAVIHGNAVKLCEMCIRYDRHVGSVISSLPLLSLPPATVEALGETLRKLLGRDGILVQYTYRLGNGPSPLAAYMERISARTVWANIPPARVEVFRARI
jgi:phosphatidylethanolamine/phosphatidyl-N-methylethanolamine N-methyltransferase